MPAHFHTLTAANKWLVKNWRLVDKHAKASTTKLIGRTDVIKKPKRKSVRRGRKARAFTTRVCIPNCGSRDVLFTVKNNSVPDWIKSFRFTRVRVVEILPKRAKRKGKKNAKA